MHNENNDFQINQNTALAKKKLIEEKTYRAATGEIINYSIIFPIIGQKNYRAEPGAEILINYPIIFSWKTYRAAWGAIINYSIIFPIIGIFRIIEKKLIDN